MAPNYFLVKNFWLLVFNRIIVKQLSQTGFLHFSKALIPTAHILCSKLSQKDFYVNAFLTPLLPYSCLMEHPPNLPPSELMYSGCLLQAVCSAKAYASMCSDRAHLTISACSKLSQISFILYVSYLSNQIINQKTKASFFFHSFCHQSINTQLY